MAPRGAMSQSKVLYTKEWTQEMDKLFIKTLVDTSDCRTYKVPDHLNMYQIASGMGAVNKAFLTSFAYDLCVERAVKLRNRFTVFKWIIGLAGVAYDPSENIVATPDFVWDLICMKEKLGYAYMVKGDADFPALEKVFGHFAKAVVDGDEHEVIEISSDHSGGTMNSENSYWNEIAWYASDSAETFSTHDISVEYAFRATSGQKPLQFNSDVEGSNPSRSSTASNSPLKKSPKN